MRIRRWEEEIGFEIEYVIGERFHTIAFKITHFDIIFDNLGWWWWIHIGWFYFEWNKV